MHGVEADLCLNETIHKGCWVLTLRAGGTSDSSQGGIVLLRKLLHLSWLSYYKKMTMISCIFLGVQHSERWKTPHTQDTMTEVGQHVHWNPPPTVT